LNKIYNEDCIDGMTRLKAESIDLIVTDPPFAIEFKSKKANYNRKASNVIEGYQDIEQKNYDWFTLNWMLEAGRVLKPDGSMYVVSGYNNLDIINNNLKQCGFTTQNHIIWKFQFGVVTRNKFVTSHYHILFVTKHKTKYDFYPNSRFQDSDKTETKGSARYKDMEDVWTIPREYWTGEKKTPTKLPEALVEKILSYSSKKGDTVLDPFLGSGTTAVVSKKMKRKYIGFEIVKEYYDFASNRLKSLK